MNAPTGLVSVFRGGVSTEFGRTMDFQFTDNGQRRRVLQDVHKVVIKVGTRLLTEGDAASKRARVGQLVTRIAALRERGLDVIVVSSGAIGAGMVALKTAKRPRAVPRLQALAAVGQSRLMYLYENACVEHGFHCAQVLLTAADVQDRERHLNLASCLDALLSSNVLPIINENDSVSVDEIRFGDNDTLAALVATLTKSDLTILLTTVAGLHTFDNGKLGKRLSVVQRLTDGVRAMARGTADTQYSVGGMTTKIHAADLVLKAGEPIWIADGRDFSVIERVFAGEDVGTLFLASNATRMRGHQRFLAFFSEYAGDIIVDKGAQRALCEKGRSLLPSGIVDVRGTFKRGDTVRVLTANGTEIARRLPNYAKKEHE